MTIALTAALFTIAAIAFAVGAATLQRVWAATGVVFDELRERQSELEDDVCELMEGANTMLDDDDSYEETDGEEWKYR
jgi:uncharacterized protein YoxC